VRRDAAAGLSPTELFTASHNSSPAIQPASPAHVSPLEDKSDAVARASNNNNHSPLSWPDNNQSMTGIISDNRNGSLVRQSARWEESSPILDREGNNISRGAPRDRQVVAGTGYGTFEDYSPKQPETDSVDNAKRLDKNRNQGFDDTSSGEEEGTVRTYNVSNSNQRIVYVKMNQLTVSSENAAGEAGGETDENGNSGIHCAVTLRAARSAGKETRVERSHSDLPRDDGPRDVGPRDGEPCDAEPRGERSCETGDSPTGKSGVYERGKPSLLVTTTVSFDENHKRNSIHMFVADVNETEHINEAEETTHV
jgi:hypothetical protein